MVDGVVTAALEISAKRAAIQREMKQALINNDLQTVVECACKLTDVDPKRLNILPSDPQENLRPHMLTPSKLRIDLETGFSHRFA